MTIREKACFIRCASQHAYYLFLPYTLAIGYLHIILALSILEDSRVASASLQQHAYNLFLPYTLAIGYSHIILALSLLEESRVATASLQQHAYNLFLSNALAN